MAIDTTPHLLLVNLGTPVAPTAEAVREFLAEFLSDPAVVDLPRWLWRPVLERAVLRSRPARVARQYESIWTPAGSPLRVATERIVDALRARAGEAFTVSAAYRYGAPSIASEMERVGGSGRPLRVVPLFPQRTEATTGTIVARARELRRQLGLTSDLAERGIGAADPGYIEALAARWREAVTAASHAPEHLIVSFHGIPVRYNRREGALYTRDCEATTAALLEATGWPREQTTLAYQSKFGPEPWLTPATARVLAELPQRGVRRVAVITPGFVTEGLETVEEIGIRGYETFRQAGGESLLRIGAVDNHPAFIESLAKLALE